MIIWRLVVEAQNMKGEFTPWQQRKLIKQYKKYLCISSEELEKLFELELSILEKIS